MYTLRQTAPHLCLGSKMPYMTNSSSEARAWVVCRKSPAEAAGRPQAHMYACHVSLCQMLGQPSCPSGVHCSTRMQGRWHVDACRAGGMLMFAADTFAQVPIQLAHAHTCSHTLSINAYMYASPCSHIRCFLTFACGMHA